MMLRSSNNQNKILNTLSTTLPDDRPITAIQIVEYIEKCPRGFLPISKTHDQDQDADLWREASFLKRRSGRYLCLSKSEGIPNFVVQDIAIVNEKSLPPQGYSVLHRTTDTEQKAWRKKQLCYRLVNTKNTNQAVTDIIVCNRLKKAPDGFTLAGEINGVTICYKMGNVQDHPASLYPVNENSANRSPPERPPRLNVSTSPNQRISAYPQISDGDGDYEILQHIAPVRPAPPRPLQPTAAPAPAHGNIPSHNYNTLNVHHDLEGVPFVLNVKLIGSDYKEMNSLPVIKAKTMQQLNREYDYDFQSEKRS